MTTTTPSPRPSLSTDPTLTPFLQTTFSAPDYLNSILPLWTPANTSAAFHQPSTSVSTSTTLISHPTKPLPIKTSSLQTTHTETQSLLTSLDAKLARLSSTLTQLTDEILRSGSRLAYEVEILTADAGSLADVLKSDAVARFIHDGDGASNAPSSPRPQAQSEADTTNGAGHDALGPGAETQEMNGNAKPSAVLKPPALETLHTLTLLRTRLTSVIKKFDAALAWSLPPSSVSNSSASNPTFGPKNNFISVTAPSGSTATSTAAEQDAEKKGLAFEAQIKRELAELLEEGPEGVSAARARVQELRALCEIWKGTREERARSRFVEGLGRFVEGAG